MLFRKKLSLESEIYNSILNDVNDSNWIFDDNSICKFNESYTIVGKYYSEHGSFWFDVHFKDRSHVPPQRFDVNDFSFRSYRLLVKRFKQMEYNNSQKKVMEKKKLLNYVLKNYYILQFDKNNSNYQDFDDLNIEKIEINHFVYLIALNEDGKTLLRLSNV